jgi:hypothetical protein
MSLIRHSWCQLHHREDGITRLARLQDDHARLLAEVMHKCPDKLASYTMPHDLSLLQLQDAIEQLRGYLAGAK